jgi:hypothetical protein
MILTINKERLTKERRSAPFFNRDTVCFPSHSPKILFSHMGIIYVEIYNESLHTWNGQFCVEFKLFQLLFRHPKVKERPR